MYATRFYSTPRRRQFFHKINHAGARPRAGAHVCVHVYPATLFYGFHA